MTLTTKIFYDQWYAIYDVVSLSRVFIFKRNAKAFSLNVIVDVRRRLRRHEMIFFNFSETVRASDFKIYHNLALHSLYIWTGKDVINYFRSAANRINVNFGACSGSDFSITVQPILKKFTVLETVIQGLHLLLCNLLDIFTP